MPVAEKGPEAGREPAICPWKCPWRILGGLAQLVLIVAGAVLSWLPVIDEVEAGAVARPERLMMLGYVGDACILAALILAFLLHRGFRAAVLDGDMGRTSWLCRSARWNGIMAIGCLAGGLVALLTTNWYKDKQGMRLSLLVMLGGFAFFGVLSLLWRLAASRANPPAHPNGEENGPAGTGN